MTNSTEERRRGGIANRQIEYQMKFRDIIARASTGSDVSTEEQKSFGPYVTISREAGSGGAELARLLGDRLGWAVLDKELVERLASDLELEPRALKMMDETRANWFSETLLNLFNSRLVAQHSYVELLGNVVALSASAGPVVVVGRGAHLILPPEPGVRVRLIAPKLTRVAAFARAEGLDHQTARRKIEKIDADRHAFIRRNFRSDPEDTSLFDLVLNADTFGHDGSIELIIQSLELRGLVPNRPHGGRLA